MLQAFRKTHKFFYPLVALVVIISFSFFGTYSELMAPVARDPVAFTAINGQDVRRSQLEEFVLFLATDIRDKSLVGSQWGPNFLNDGVIINDILETGLGTILFEAYADQLKPDIKPRFQREKKASFYVHPQAGFISAEALWGYFAPSLKQALDELRMQTNPMSAEAFDARTKLYLAEKQFPSSSLRQLIRYQEQQYKWIPPDVQLDYTNLALFDYDNIEDWYGPRYLRLVAEFIINAARIAEQKGFSVSNEEALADLQRNASTSLAQLRDNPQFAGLLPGQFMREQLMRMHLTEQQAVSIWRDVLLFRRLFQGTGNAVLLDKLPFQQFNAFALETIEGDFYELPEPLRIADFEKLTKFETYLRAVEKKEGRGHPLEIPREIRDLREIASEYPELVQKRYLVDLSEVNLRSLQSRVGIREMWDWQVSEKGWGNIGENFPQVAALEVQTPDDRFKALDRLNEATRSKIDEHSRMQIVKSNPAWIDEALDKANISRKTLSIPLKGGMIPLDGVENQKELLSYLDGAPLWDKSQQISDPLKRFTGDGVHFFRIAVVDRAKQPVLVEFEEISATDQLNKILDRQLEPYYKEMRASSPEKFQKEDGTYRQLSDVRELVAREYFKPLLESLKEVGNGEEQDPNSLASKRFYQFVKTIEKSIQKNPSNLSQWIDLDDARLVVGNQLPKAQPFTHQWKLKKRSKKIQRNEQANKGEAESLFQLSTNQWSPIESEKNGNLWFFNLKNKDSSQQSLQLLEQMRKAHRMLSNDVQKVLMRKTVGELKSKEALSLNYLQPKSESEIEPDK